MNVHTATFAFKFQTGVIDLVVEMDIGSLLRESKAHELQTTFGFQTEVGREQFRKQLTKFTPNIGILQRRQETILHLRKNLTPEMEAEIETIFNAVRDIEPDLSLFFDRTDVESDSYGQLLFSPWKSFQVLNTIPFALLALAFYKQFIVPALAVMMPLLMITMPFVVLKFVYHLPLTIEQYIQMMSKIMGLQNLDITNPRTILQGSLTLFSVGQSIYQPIQNSLHLQTIHKEMMRKANALQILLQGIHTLETHIPSLVSFKYSLQDLEKEDIHRLFASVWDSPYRLRLALTTLGDAEVIYRMAKADCMNPVRFLGGSTPYLKISQGVDPFLETPIPFEFHLSGQTHHAILTGPNRGGKSSVLRTTLLTIVTAQTLGFASGSVDMRPFDWIATGLRLEDRPGSFSMFESEVDFSIKILQRAKDHPEQIGFIVFDELFHSTNPPDGARTADIFLQRLWQTPNTASFISTHVFDLAKKAHKKIQKLCVPAHPTKDGTLQFTYTLQKGICEVSSVDQILKEKGLLSAEKSTPENPRQ
jgi:hypothetical protein